MLNAAIWLAAAVQNVGGQAPTLPVVVPMMLANAGLMAAAAVVLGVRWRSAVPATVALMAVNAVLTATDQVGPWDLVTLLVDLAILGLLFAWLRRTAPARPPSPGRRPG